MAKRLDLTVPHSLSSDEALARMQALGDYYKNAHHAQVGWDGHQGSVNARYLGMHLDVAFAVGDREVRLDGKDPGLLLRGKVTSYLKKKLEAYLDPRTPLEDLPRR
jgi:hypothetical protein